MTRVDLLKRQPDGVESFCKTCSWSQHVIFAKCDSS